MKGNVGRQWWQKRLPPRIEAEESQPIVAVHSPAVIYTRTTLRSFLFLLMCLVCATAISYFVFRYVAPRFLAPTIPHELVGVWQVTEGEMQGATLEFTWYGTASAVVFRNGKREVTNSTVKVEQNKIFLTTRDEKTGKEDTVFQTIISLTPDELIIRDADMNTYKMVRVHN